MANLKDNLHIRKLNGSNMSLERHVISLYLFPCLLVHRIVKQAEVLKSKIVQKVEVNVVL